MTTTICDVHVGCLRKRGILDLETWLKDPNHVYIARDGVLINNGLRFPRLNSPWSNPFKVKGDVTLDMALVQYFGYIMNKIKSGELYEELHKLKGKELGCWCVGDCIHSNCQPPFKCHGQILIWLINYYFPDTK